MLALFVLVFVAGVCFLIARLIYLFFKERWSETWPSTVGQILSAEIKESYSDDGRQFNPRVTYAYWINGIAYTSSKMSLVGRAYYTPHEAAHILQQYPVGSYVTVWFNPHNFTDALIKRGSIPGWVLLVILFIGLAFIGMVVLVYAA